MGDTERAPVFVVEDDTSIRELIAEALTREGLEALTAGDGEEAIALAEQKRPGVVVLDIGLPLLDGREVARRIREKHGDGIPFVVVTAGGRLEEAAQAIGAASYVGKPFDLDDLVRVVKAALEPPPAAVPIPAPQPVL